MDIAQYLVSRHSPKQIDILQEYGLTVNDLPWGVLCQDCTHPMHYQKGIWHCPKCHSVSKDAHIEAINDHFLLIKPTITNRECQTILRLPTSDVTRRILITLDLPTTGHTKNRVYHQWAGDKSYQLMEEKIITQRR